MQANRSPCYKVGRLAWTSNNEHHMQKIVLIAFNRLIQELTGGDISATVTSINIQAITAEM